MLYESDIIFLIQQWENRAAEKHEDPYLIALRECIEELRKVLNAHYDEEAAADDIALAQFVAEQEADRYLSSLESLEAI
jgi:hypothetical protein